MGVKTKFEHQKSPDFKAFCFSSGVPDVIRTHDRTLRRRMLYPAELPGHIQQGHIDYIIIFWIIQANL